MAVDLAGVKVNIEREADVAAARQHARLLAERLGLDPRAQTRLATAVSEIARNAWQHAGGGQVAFFLMEGERPALLAARISDHGRGLPDGQAMLDRAPGLGLVSARRLADRFELQSAPGQGTTVTLGVRFPAHGPQPTPADLLRAGEQLANAGPATPAAELRQQSTELARALTALHQAEQALASSQAEVAELNHELESTNRGVVALYAELDEKAEQLKRADALKTRFFSQMSHEFKTPVNSILALTRLLLDRVDGDLTNEQAKQVGFIRQSAQELGDLVNDLLDLVKVEAGYSVVRPGPLEVAVLFDTLRGMFRPLATNPAVALVIEEPPPLPTLLTDEGKIAQILRNFISNALKFTEQGEVRVAAALADAGQRICFRVADTGIGIAPADQEHIFREFGQVENPIQKRVRGTGLGLALSRRLAQLLGGELTLQSALGRGSTFALYLPLVYGAAREPGAAEPGSAAGPRRRILIVDDDEIARYMLRGHLAGQAAEILEAEDGTLGLRLAQEAQPDVIILDLVMPGLGGWEVLEQLDANPATRGIPLIILTSQALDASERQWLGQRAAAVLSKEISATGGAAEAIAAALEKAMDKHGSE
jgi:signal transduction histidine kinase/ActR/RegA family two-component response regulator